MFVLVFATATQGLNYIYKKSHPPSKKKKKPTNTAYLSDSPMC